MRIQKVLQEFVAISSQKKATGRQLQIKNRRSFSLRFINNYLCISTLVSVIAVIC